VKEPLDFATQLDRQRAIVLRFIEKHAGGALLRVESSEDLAQDVCALALRHAERLELRGEPAFRAWLFEIAKNHMADRRDYWSALKRAGAVVLRLGVAESGDASWHEVRDVAASVTGPSTFAARREQLALAARALSLLLPRDRALVEAVARGVTAREQALELGWKSGAVESARKRALERYRKTFQLVVRDRRGPPAR
jgi:RNA polymerase sigma factor (sigma-70 family)